MRPLVIAIVLVSATATARREAPRPPLSIAPLSWDMNVPVAQATLELAKMSPQYDETRRYMAMTKDQPYVRHTTEPGLSYVPRPGWRGYAHFAWSEVARDERIDRVTLVAEKLTTAQKKDELAALRSRYGAPREQGQSLLVWRQGGTRLGAGVSYDPASERWTLSLAYTLER